MASEQAHRWYGTGRWQKRRRPPIAAGTALPDVPQPWAHHGRDRGRSRRAAPRRSGPVLDRQGAEPMRELPQRTQGQASRSVAMTRASGQTDGRQTPGIRCTDVRGRASDKVDGFERKKLRRKRGSARERRGGVATRQPLVNIAPSGNQNDIGCRRISNTSLCRRRHQPSRPPLPKIRPGSPAPVMGPGTG